MRFLQAYTHFFIPPDQRNTLDFPLFKDRNMNPSSLIGKVSSLVGSGNFQITTKIINLLILHS